jgi:hypothetical protein
MWILVLFIHVGSMGEGNSVAVTNIPGFVSFEECKQAGKDAKGLVSGTVKDLGYTCLKQTK